VNVCDFLIVDRGNRGTMNAQMTNPIDDVHVTPAGMTLAAS
jgi:hypothetical protein